MQLASSEPLLSFHPDCLSLEFVVPVLVGLFAQLPGVQKPPCAMQTALVLSTALLVSAVVAPVFARALLVSQPAELQMLLFQRAILKVVAPLHLQLLEAFGGHALRPPQL